MLHISVVCKILIQANDKKWNLSKRTMIEFIIGFRAFNLGLDEN